MSSPLPDIPGARVSYEQLVALRALAMTQPDRGARAESRSGGLAGRRRGTGLDIRDLRLFSEGDDMRHLDASATARTGKPHVRTFHEEQDKAALLVADFRAPMFWGTRRRLRSVAAAEALAIAGWQVVESGGKAGLLALRDGDSDYLRPALGTATMMRIAAALERAHDGAWADASGSPPATPLDGLIERAGRLAPSGSALVVATGLDLPGGDFDNVVSALARRLRLVFLLVRDAVERDPPKGALPYWSDGNVAWGRFGGVTEDSGKLERLGAEVHAIDAATDDSAMTGVTA